MKKTLKLVGIVSVFVLAMFLNTSVLDSNTSAEFNLTDAIAMQSANAEGCPWYVPDYLCDDYYPPYGEEAVPYANECIDYSQPPTRVYNNEYDVYGHLEYETYTVWGTICEDAETAGPLYCEAEPAEC
ncbi:hypothetical protein [Hyunsoonleella ulvae]|uniref:hypothetical protein n=1 Tax=Hyunsoonleella ulvae TaxID=2799948 RepID=UPI00193943FA|nr:hypothetical protein [Hyunsoonleella ulvae]